MTSRRRHGGPRCWPRWSESEAVAQLADHRVDDRDQVPTGLGGDRALALVGRPVPRDLGDRAELLDAVEAARHRLETLEQIIEVRSEEHTSELQSLMRTSYAVLCLKKKKSMLH